jgi:hypothetical protein
MRRINKFRNFCAAFPERSGKGMAQKSRNFRMKARPMNCHGTGLVDLWIKERRSKDVRHIKPTFQRINDEF